MDTQSGVSPSPKNNYIVLPIGILCLHPVVDIGHRDSHLIVPSRYIIFPEVSWPSPRSSSLWMDYECFDLGSRCVILLMCAKCQLPDLVLVCSAGCMFNRRLISSFLILSILVFPAAFLRHLISVVVNIYLSLLVRVQFSLW